MTAKEFITSLEKISNQYTCSTPKRELFSLAKEFQYMAVLEVIKLLQNKNDDLRLCAVSILDWKARNKKTSEDQRQSIYLAYIQNLNYINDWGMVDRAAPYVVGGYLFDKDKTILYDLAKSKNPMARRTAIVCTYYFIRKNKIDETFDIAEILINDNEHFVQTAVGSWVREAGKKDEKRLRVLLDKYSETMPRTTLRLAIQKLDQKVRKHYLEIAKNKKGQL